MFEIMSGIPSPEELKESLPISPALKKIKEDRDAQIRAIFEGHDSRFILIIGPCSADNEAPVLDYMKRLAEIHEEVKDKIFIIPRVYTNKPRTIGTGYKGMLHQPDPEAKPDIFEGLKMIRRLQLRVIEETGFTVADEMLYPENLDYFDDILSYIAVGARSSENQLHRLVASGINVPVGMKNPTGGDLSVMVNSVIASHSSHTFMFRQNMVKTSGNPLAHGILRGYVNKHGDSKPNYHYEDLMLATRIYKEANLPNTALIVDTNHANSGKNFAEQPRIAKEIIHSRNYNPELGSIIKGLMIESYLEEGAQAIGSHVYGKSITDACLGWKDTEKLIRELAELL